MFQYLLGMAGNENASLYDCEQEFRRNFASMKEEEFTRKWGVTRHFLKELIKAEKPEYTKLIRAASKWGIQRYHVYEFNISDIKHNKELIKLLLAISAVWNLSLSIEERRVDVTDAIEKAFEDPEPELLGFREDYKDIYTAFCEDKNKRQSYIYIQNNDEQPISNIPKWDDLGIISSMGMKVSEIDVLIY